MTQHFFQNFLKIQNNFFPVLYYYTIYGFVYFGSNIMASKATVVVVVVVVVVVMQISAFLDNMRSLNKITH